MEDIQTSPTPSPSRSQRSSSGSRSPIETSGVAGGVLPWCAQDLIKSKAIDAVVIKGKFASSDEILEGIELVEKILEKPKLFKNQKLPFKHVRKSFYQTNHFSGEVVSAQGQDFKFSRNIKPFDWGITKPLTPDPSPARGEGSHYNINLRLSKLAQLKELEKYIKKSGRNPVYSIEYGEILSTFDLAAGSFHKILTKVKKFCQKYDIKLQLSTPRTLIERDFDRVFEYEKQMILGDFEPASVIINNIGYFWAFINDPEVNHIPIEIGQGINLLNSLSIKCLNNLAPIEAVDFTSFADIEHALRTIKKIKNEIPVRKYTVAGNVRVPSLGLCPLNNDSAIISRLSCTAPCHKGEFALNDPSLNKVFPFTCDGFCRMHMFEDRILEDFDKVDELYKAGVNEFVFDFSEVSFMDSSGIGMVMGRYKAASETGGKVVVMGISEPIRRIFEISGLKKIIPCVQTTEEARKILG